MEQPSDLQVSLLLANLGFFDSQIPLPLAEHLQHLLQIAQRNLQETCGIPIDPENLKDASLTAMYAAWLYSRGRTGEAKPPMLQTAIRNRQLDLAKSRGAANA